MDEVIAEVDTDKVTVEIRSPCAGVIVELMAEEGDNVSVGGDLFKVEEGAKGEKKAAAPAPAEAPVAQEAPAAAAPPPPPPPPTPTAAAPPVAPAPPPAPRPASDVKLDASPLPAPHYRAGSQRVETRVPMSRMRTRIAERLKESQNTAAMLTTFNEVDMSRLIALRATHKEAFEKVH